LLPDQLRTIEAATADLRQQSDGERLHDLRVALRRARALVGASADVFPEHMRDRCKRDLRRANELTSRLRDLDVLLAAFPAYKARLPAASRPYVEMLRREIERNRQPAWNAMRAGLESGDWQQWIDGWRAFLESTVPKRSALAHAKQSVRELAVVRIDRALAQVIRRGRRIAGNTPGESLHRLRLKVKRLRYLVEAFRSLYEDADGVGELIAALKSFQDYLGAHQDLEVHARAIAAQAARLEAGGRASPALLRAAGALTEALLAERGTVRALYAARFAAFDTLEHLAAFRALAPAG
jgi:CHAD domain-containing protein